MPIKIFVFQFLFFLFLFIYLFFSKYIDGFLSESLRRGIILFHPGFSHFLWLFLTGVWVTGSLFRSLFGNLVDYNNALVCMVLILPLISHSSIHFSKILETVPSAPSTTGITFILMFQSKIPVLAFFYFHAVVRWNSKIHSMTSSFFFFFLVNYHSVWSSGWD